MNHNITPIAIHKMSQKFQTLIHILLIISFVISSAVPLSKVSASSGSTPYASENDQTFDKTVNSQPVVNIKKRDTKSFDIKALLDNPPAFQYASSILEAGSIGSYH